MTPLEALIRRRIAAEGPMSVADYMALCLGHPEHGYYTTRDPLGAGGDFTTAPEISQMFGEMLGLWLATIWQAAGQPAPCALVELGPGRGTLMADLLRASAGVPGFHAAATPWLVETSPTLRAAQAERLAAAAPRWAARVDDLPDLPLFAVANEFFDALPIRQWVSDGGRWRERMVGVEGGRLSFGLSPPLAGEAAGEAAGTVLERSPAGEAVAAALGARIAARGGALLAVDYGAWDGRGDTLQAVARHAPTDPLAAPGEADLTAHVRFSTLAAAARLPVAGFGTQGAFLAALGIGHRAEALARARPDAAETTAASLQRLTAPDQMGEVFKVLALLPEGAQPPPGLPPCP